MHRILCISLLGFLLGSVVILPTAAFGSDDSKPAADAQAAASGLVLENLLQAQLEGVEGTEVIVSRVTIPAHTSLPKHWHPGEEFAYVLEGSVTLWQDGKEDTTGMKGDVLKVPLKQVHTAITGEEGATLLVFRVHEQGKPERIPVD